MTPIRYSSLGTTRAVLVIGDLALKFARHELGARCNLSEANVFATATEGRRAMLCPVVWCSPNGAVLAMRAARPCTQGEIQQLIDTDGFPNWDHVGLDDYDCPFERKPSDWGYRDGRLVALDYSMPI
jgi:hypothetical protein